MRFASRVIRGSGHGRTIGYPTANLTVTDSVRRTLRRFGVYAAYVTVRGERRGAALFWGHRTLFHDEEPACEALLIDFEGDIHGEEVEVEIVEFVRDTITVEHEDDLKRLIKDDIQKVKTIL
ncbi:MAG: riboflavin kinase [Parcubacteria group bacterium]|nr:riboflavin kinase [Parcubacteria group bacterium]